MTCRKPMANEQTAATIAQDIFGLSEITEVKELISFSDRNFLIKTTSEDRTPPTPHKFVLKVLNSTDSQHPESVLAEIKAMMFLRDKGFPCPEMYAIKDNSSEHMALVDLSGTTPAKTQMNADSTDKSEICLVRLIAFLEGTTVNLIDRSPELLYKVGKFVGSLSKQLKDFSHEGIKSRTLQEFKWNILEFLNIERYINVFSEGKEEKLIRQVHNAFITNVKPQLHHFRSGTVHNDLNGENILVIPPTYSVNGIIDFGDLATSVIISELSNSMTFFMGGDRGIEFGGYLLAGYQSVFPLPVQERELLYYFVVARLCQLVMYSKQDTSLANVQACLERYYGILHDIWGRSKDEVEQVWKEAEMKMIS